MRNGSSCTLALGIARTLAVDLMVEAGVPYSPVETDISEFPMSETLRQYLTNGWPEKTEYELRYSSPSEGNALKGITVYSDLIATDLGLRIGDNMDRVMALYGLPHNTVPSYDTYVSCEYFIGIYKIAVSLHDDTVTDWTVEINTPEASLMLTSSSVNQVYLYLMIPLPEAAQRLSEAGISFENLDGAEKESNTSCWRLMGNGIDLYFGASEERPAPSVYKTEYFSLYKYTVKTPSHQTEKGIAVGNTEEKLLRTYGPAKEVREQDGVYEYYYVIDEGRYLAGDTELVFTVESQKIVNWYVCNPWMIEFDASN
jgi:hypothetical protein